MKKCKFCGEKDGLYEVKKEGELTGEYICEDCLEKQDEYDTCLICKLEGKLYVYPREEVNDEYCPEHQNGGLDEDELEDMENFREYHFNH